MSRKNKKRQPTATANVEEEEDVVVATLEETDPVNIEDYIDSNPEEVMALLKKKGFFKEVPPERIKPESEVELDKAAAALGVDTKERSTASRSQSMRWEKIINDTAKYIDLLKRSQQWKSLLSPSEKYALHGVRVFIRQLRGETAPRGEAATLRELVAAAAKSPTGPLDKIGVGFKSARLTDAQLRKAGVGQSVDEDSDSSEDE